MFVPILNFWAVTKVRGLIREKKGIEGSCMNDFIMWFVCGICALVQEAQEVEWDKEGQLMVRE
jgi:Cys-rich protein (TIGR01571 family)